jgi:hypothetical protein
MLDVIKVLLKTKKRIILKQPVHSTVDASMLHVHHNLYLKGKE